jgi:hypothetical protein
MSVRAEDQSDASIADFEEAGQGSTEQYVSDMEDKESKQPSEPV